MLVSAGAGSGKTSVLVERFVQAVLADGCAGGVDPGHHLHREGRRAADQPGAARGCWSWASPSGRGRPRRRGSRPSTASARGVLRTHALAAGLDPDFRVLDALEAERLAIDAFDRALAGFIGTAEDPGRLALLAAYTPDRLADMVRTAHGHLRSRGERSPRLQEIAPAAGRGPARGARGGRSAPALAELAPPRARATAERTRARLDRCQAVLEALAPDAVADPGDLDKLGFKPSRQGASRARAAPPTWRPTRPTPTSPHVARAPRPLAPARPDGALRRALRRAQARALGPGLRRPGAGRPRPAGRARRACASSTASASRT